MTEMYGTLYCALNMNNPTCQYTGNQHLFTCIWQIFSSYVMAVKLEKSLN
jgi:hypothetical protein